MDTSRVNELKDRADIVKRATIEGENDRYRIGQLFYDIVDYDGEQSNAIDALEKKSAKMQEQIEDIAEGGGGGGGTSGRQRTFFYNTSDSAVPGLPSVSDYDSTTDTFNHNGQVWKSTNINVQDNEVTWMIWSWFSGDAPQTVDGPIKANPGGGGSNGVDANETEWVYMRTEVKMSTQVYEEWRENLENAKGTDGYGHKDYTQPDIQPTGWTDNPTGIDPDHKYEYASYRTSSIGTDGKRVWGTTGFSAPILWSAYGERGTDGDGVEYIFYADKNGSYEPGNGYPPDWTNDTNFQDPEYIRNKETSRWKDDPIDLEGEGFGPGSVEWVSMRKKQNGQWQSYSVPAVWSRLGKDGVVDGYTVDLANENMPVNTDEDGKVTGYTNRGWIQVFHNSDTVEYADSADSTHFTYTIGTVTRSDGGSVSDIYVTKNSSNKTQVDVNISNLSGFKSINAYIPIIITLPNMTTRTMEFTLYGVVGGEFIDMYVGTKVIRVTDAGADPRPNEIEIGVTLGKTTYKSVWGGGSGSAEALGYTFAYRFDDNNPVVHAGNISVATGHSSLTVYMYKDNNFIDSEVIPYVKDGKNGEDSPYYVEDYGISASRTDHSDITDSDWSPNQPEPTEQKPYVWKRSRLYNPSTHKYGDPIYVCLTGEKGPGGGGGSGDDGWMILASPANVILTQSLDNTSRFSSATVSFMAKKGNVTVNIDSISSPTGVHFYVEKSGKTVIVTSPQSYGDSYYTEGSFKVNIYVTDPDTNSTVTFEDITVPCYANLLGTWKETVEAGARTVAANQVVWEMDDRGVPAKNTYDYNAVQNAAQSAESWTSEMKTEYETVSKMNQRISNANGNLDRVEKHIPAPNLFDSTDWTYNGTNFPLAEKDTANNRFYDKTTNNDMFSPIVRLEAGTYTFSAYVRYENFDTGTNSFAINYVSSGDPRSATTVLAPSSVGTVSGETKIINGITYYRRYAVFTINSTCYVSINLWGTYGSGSATISYADVAYPKLEKGGVATAYFMDSASVIKQTADEIDLSIRNDLGETGININGSNRAINLYGGKVTFSDKNGGNTDKIWIDPDKGTLHAKNGVFTGTVNANLFYGRTLTVTTSSYTIDPSTNPYNMYLYNNPTTDSQLYLPDAATYDGLEINVFVVPPRIGMSKVVRVYAGSEKIQAMNNYHIAKDDYSDNGIVVRGYDADASLFTASYVVLREGVKYIFKSINGTWYVLDGLCNSGDS